MEQSQDESYLTIPQCPKCNGKFIYIEEVLIHKCSTKTEDFREEYQDLLELRQALSEDLKLRTLKRNETFLKFYRKGATMHHDHQEC